MAYRQHLVLPIKPTWLSKVTLVSVIFASRSGPVLAAELIVVPVGTKLFACSDMILRAFDGKYSNPSSCCQFLPLSRNDVGLET